MPKEKSSKIYLLHQWISWNSTLTTNGYIVYAKSCGKYIASVTLGKLVEYEPGTFHLIAFRVLEQTNHSIIARVARAALRVLWPDQENEGKLLLIVTDAAAYMIMAAINI
ncbi:hypothetical protein L9F63_023510 [Diploptera punctata]|uniref:Uncharacterized protein n=1 Tax=Diploptera punctata TaxID=6984 RepID=A0AAD8E8M1_DIPPU|nr:hypothetical protein L9F63_023510 [Diploptera punctata]